MNITPSQHKTLLQELAEAITTIPDIDTIDPDTEVTIPDLMEQTGRNHHTTTAFLKRNGYRPTRQVRSRVNGKATWVWRKQ